MAEARPKLVSFVKAAGCGFAVAAVFALISPNGRQWWLNIINSLINSFASGDNTLAAGLTFLVSAIGYLLPIPFVFMLGAALTNGAILYGFWLRSGREEEKEGKEIAEPELNGTHK